PRGVSLAGPLAALTEEERQAHLLASGHEVLPPDRFAADASQRTARHRRPPAALIRREEDDKADNDDPDKDQADRLVLADELKHRTSGRKGGQASRRRKFRS